jgi:hypothetical protein
MLEERRTGRLLVVGPFALALVLGAGCGDECEDLACPAVACQEPFSLVVTDAGTGQPVPSASASSAGLSCSATGGLVRCDAGEAPATYDVVVSAPGYETRQVSVTVEPRVATGACECPRCQEWQPHSVALAHSSR